MRAGERLYGVELVRGCPASSSSPRLRFPADLRVGVRVCATDLHALWLYVLGPILGTSLGALTYQFIRGEPATVANDSYYPYSSPAPMLEPFRYAFVQRGVVELLLLALCAGVVGSFVVLRGLAFFTHAVGTATFPGLVLADGIGLSAVLGAAASALVFAGGVERASRGRRVGYDSLTALVLVGSLAGGVILASDVFHSGSNIETLLFGSLLVIGRQELLFAAAAGAAAVLLSALLGRRWLALGFDGEYATAVGLRSPLPEAALLVLIALSATVSVSAVGALLVTALFIVPAATVRLFTRRLFTLQVGAVVLAAVEGVVGIWLSVEWNVPPGAAIAVLSGGCFVATATLAALRRHRALLLPGFAVLAFLAAGCGASSRGGSGRLDVVATTTQIGDWTRQVGGDAIDVHQLLQPNTDPHDYEPRPADVESTAGAKVVFENGDELDHWMAKVVSEAGGSPAVVVLGEHVPVERAGETGGPEASRYDAHWWHDPRNAISAVEQIRDALVAADSTHAGVYRRQAAAYLARLRALDRGIEACFAKVPAAERKLVTDHDAFGYFAGRYAVTVVGAVIPSQTTQAQPSARDTARLIALVKREHVKAVFPESSINPRLAQAIARETGASAHYTLYGDTLGPKGSAGATYLSMEAANANAMVNGFSGGRLSCGLSAAG
jgi:zinc/manganese transport system substrate-binding protein